MTSTALSASTGRAPARRRGARPTVALGLVAALGLAACGGDDGGSSESESEFSDAIDCAAVPEVDLGGSLTIYSGRNEELVGPLIDCFGERYGVDLEVRYTSSSEEAAQLIATEGDKSPADVFFSQSPGSMGFLANEGRLQELPAELLDLVAPEYRSVDDNWVGTSGRVRVLAYNTDELSEADLPASVYDLTDPDWKGAVGVAPTNGSFQDFVSAIIATDGEAKAAEFLDGLAANEARTYANNTSVLDAVARGEVKVGLVNHYYLAQRLTDEPDIAVANHYLTGDIGSIILVASVGVLDTAGDQTPQAEAFVEYLLSDPAQQYFVDTVKEYPILDDIELPTGQPALAEIDAPAEDLNLLGGLLEQTVTLIEESGLADG